LDLSVPDSDQGFFNTSQACWPKPLDLGRLADLQAKKSQPGCFVSDFLPEIRAPLVKAALLKFTGTKRGTMHPVKSARNDEETQREHVNRYNEIGISAVAAAMRYYGNAKTQEDPAVAKRRYQSILTADAA